MGSIVRQQNYLTGQKAPLRAYGLKIFKCTITAASGDGKMETRPAILLEARISPFYRI